MTTKSDDAKERKKTRKEKLAGFFYNLAQLSFAGLVIGGITPLFNQSIENANWWLIVLGCFSTYVFASFANRTLK